MREQVTRTMPMFYRLPLNLWKRSRVSIGVAWLIGVLLACSPIHQLLAASTSQSFGLQGGTQLAAGRATSAGFSLQSCVSAEPVGHSTSATFRLQSGCLSLAAAAMLPPVVPPLPPNPGESTAPVPTTGRVTQLFLILLIALLGTVLIRRQSGLHQ